LHRRLEKFLFAPTALLKRIPSLRFESFVDKRVRLTRSQDDQIRFLQAPKM
jgi:hypothetical protein